MASPTRWMWVWVNSGSWWWTGRPWRAAVHRVAKNRTTMQLNWTELDRKESDTTERQNWISVLRSWSMYAATYLPFISEYSTDVSDLLFFPNPHHLTPTTVRDTMDQCSGRNPRGPVWIIPSLLTHTSFQAPSLQCLHSKSMGLVVHNCYYYRSNEQHSSAFLSLLFESWLHNFSYKSLFLSFSTWKMEAKSNICLFSWKI